jgi:hypothetical protein
MARSCEWILAKHKAEGFPYHLFQRLIGGQFLGGPTMLTAVTEEGSTSGDAEGLWIVLLES